MQPVALFDQPPTRLAEYEVGEAIEIRSFLKATGDFHWISGYFVVVQKWRKNHWWYAIARPLIRAQIGANTQTTEPIYYPETVLRKAQVIERHPQIISHYHGKNYWVTLSAYYRQIELPHVEV